MTESAPTSAPIFQPRVWHLALLVLFVAIAIVNIQDQRLEDPKMIALAAAGFVLYWILGWLGWRIAHRYEARLGALPVLILYLTAMAALFLVASGIFLMIMLALTK
jgi:hypothetical protein